MRSVNFVRSFALLSALSLVQTAFGAYFNSTNTTSTSTPSVPTGAPYLVGGAHGGSPLWNLHVPGSLGPWTELTFSSAGGSNYNFDFNEFVFTESEGLSISTSGNSFTVTYTGPAPSGEFVASLFTTKTSGSLFGITLYVAVDTGSGDLRKRDVLTWTLTDTVSITPDATSSSASESGPFTYSSYTVTTLTIDGTETLTVTVPCVSGTPISAPTTGPVTLYTTTETVIGGVTTTVTVPCSTAAAYPGESVSVFEGAGSSLKSISKNSVVGYVAMVAISYAALIAL